MTDSQAALESLLGYFGPLATERAEAEGLSVLCTPSSNVLALNAAYALPGQHTGEALAWQRARGRPPVLCSPALPGPFQGNGREVAALRVGVYAPGSWVAEGHTDPPSPEAPVVEQVSRLHLSAWARVLAQSYDAPAWASLLARQLGEALEQDRQSALLLAYTPDGAVGALLWRPGAAHLWGSLETRAVAPLLDTAAGLEGGPVWTSLPVAPDGTGAIPLSEETRWGFFLVEERGV